MSHLPRKSPPPHWGRRPVSLSSVDLHPALRFSGFSLLPLISRAVGLCAHPCNAEQLGTPLKQLGFPISPQAQPPIAVSGPFPPLSLAPISLLHFHAQIPVGFSFSTINWSFESQPPFAIHGFIPLLLVSPPAKVFLQTKAEPSLRGAVGWLLVCGVSLPLREPGQRGVEAGELWPSQTSPTAPSASSQVGETL